MLNEMTWREEFSSSNSFWDTERGGCENRSTVWCGLLSALHGFQHFEPAKSFFLELYEAAVPATSSGSSQSLTLTGFCPSCCALCSPCTQWLLPRNWHRSRAPAPPSSALGAAWAQQPFPSGSSTWTGSPHLCSLHSSRSPGLPSRVPAGTGGSQVPQAAVTPLHTGGKSGRGCAESQVHVAAAAVGVICPALPQSQGSDPGTAAAPSGSATVWVLLSVPAEAVAGAVGADSAPSPRARGVPGQGLGGSCPLFSLCSTQSWAGHKWGSTANREPVSLFQPCLLSLALGAAGGQRQLLLVPLCVPVFSSAAPSVCAQQWGKASALQGQELLGSA
ncbi:uncharacterized protein LOC130266921 [Oenanthe melanoleuca]|uniref:uncharacterized protein LOC130266921 n=1 Tax=Oenanthe melanoleuca TaxID=2939378 RepID=UPI0024C16A9B|nr:uncharacterized protein LOC130266921 [Oenanthe melanoleuca]